MAGFSVWIAIALLAVLGVSGAMFWLHVRRSTHMRRWLTLRDWAARNGFRLYRRRDARVPEVLAGIVGAPIAGPIVIASKQVSLVEIDIPADPAVAPATPQRRHVLVQALRVNWPVTALRPVATPQGLIDRLALPRFDAFLPSDRLTVHSLDPAAARLLARSMVTALLPSDVGLLLHGTNLILDFSSRHYDGIELSRMLALAQQLAAHLPPLSWR